MAKGYDQKISSKDMAKRDGQRKLSESVIGEYDMIAIGMRG